MTDNILHDAARAFRRFDKARADLRAAEDDIRKLCRAYDMASGCRGIRSESLRLATEHRFGKRAA
jgi:hypothetical protein